MWTAITAAVAALTSAATDAGSTARVAGSQSANRRRPPAASTAAAVAWNVLEGTITSRPSTPTDRRMISSVLVPEATATAWAAP